MFAQSDPITAAQRAELREYARNAFAATDLPRVALKEVVAVAGTPVTLTGLELAIDFDESRIHGYQLPLAKIDQWTVRLAGLTLKERVALKGMQAKRADVIVAGATILGEAVRRLGQIQVTVSTRGVR